MNKGELIKLTSKINQYSCPKSVNFHCHTIFSDGSLGVDALIEQAYKNNIKVLSITDHHTIKAHEYIEKNNIISKYPVNSIEIVSGIEINCLLLGCLVHVIGLGIDIESKYLYPYILGESPIGNNLQINSVTKAINSAGGLSFLAHPARYRIPFYKLIPEAKKKGVDGIEVWYDYELNQKWEPSLFVCSQIDKLADKYSMLKSCGTDSHGLSLLGR
tara:strand:- start:62 stop:709 length:648 start_codon:yes stop_codon:yes gene_type:complete